jgi:hypothetical protein
MWVISLLAEDLLAYEERLCLMELATAPEKLVKSTYKTHMCTHTHTQNTPNS